MSGSKSVCGGSKSDDCAGDAIQCYLCSLPVGCGKIFKVKGKTFDFDCISAVRCGRRIAEGKSKEAGQKFIDRMCETPEEWRQEVMPLKCVDGKRGADVRRLAKQVIHGKEEFYEEGTLSDRMVLNKKRILM